LWPDLAKDEVVAWRWSFRLSFSLILRRRRCKIRTAFSGESHSEALRIRTTDGFDKQIYAAGTTRRYSLIFSCEQNKAESTVRVCIVHQISFDFAGPQSAQSISLLELSAP
jgi:hypothetical protein